jgi:hypothetical protein
MAKLKWGREPVRSSLNSEYWLDPKTGFDEKWHNQRAKMQQSLGIHKDHNWQIINKPTGPHAGKIICNTCNNKFVVWLPKGYISPNT